MPTTWALLQHVELVKVDAVTLHVIHRQRLPPKVAVEIDRGMRAEIEIAGGDRLPREVGCRRRSRRCPRAPRTISSGLISIRQARTDERIDPVDTTRLRQRPGTRNDETIDVERAS